jgi:hypothetical protein
MDSSTSALYRMCGQGARPPANYRAAAGPVLHADPVADGRDDAPAVAWFDLSGSRPDLEERGLRMTAAMAHRMRLGIDLELGPAVPPGPHFDYDAGPNLFLGRHGSGPLDVVWDTNVLIDYFQYGETLWNGEALPDTIDDEHGEQLEALQVVVSLWTVRDVRFHLLPRILEDAKRALSERNQANRVRALYEFANALTLATYYDDNPPQDAVASRSPSALARLLESLPSGADRLLVEDAVRRECACVPHAGQGCAEKTRTRDGRRAAPRESAGSARGTRRMWCTSLPTRSSAAGMADPRSAAHDAPDLGVAIEHSRLNARGGSRLPCSTRTTVIYRHAGSLRRE